MRTRAFLAMFLILVAATGCTLNKMTPQAADEEAIEADVRASIARAVPDKTFALEVKVDGTVVSISGHVDNSGDRQKIIEAARSVSGVSRVIDNLHVS